MRDEKTAAATVHADDFVLGFHSRSLPELHCHVAQSFIEESTTWSLFGDTVRFRDTVTTMRPVRVVAGTLRGRNIVAPSGTATRPTTDRTREAMFNALASLDVLEDASVADLFAGSGALGIEALSRGAAKCVFVENDTGALASIRQNLRSLDLESRARVIAGRVESVVSSLSDVDVVLMDPPYGFERWRELLDGLRSVVSEDAVIVVESGSPIDADTSLWEVVRSKRYGRTWVTFLRQL